MVIFAQKSVTKKQYDRSLRRLWSGYCWNMGAAVPAALAAVLKTKKPPAL
jgi:hypothetical protein